MPETAIAMLTKLMAYGNYPQALKLAANWDNLGEHRDSIQTAWAAYGHPKFYVGMGKDPKTLIAAGIAAIRERYDL